MRDFMNYDFIIKNIVLACFVPAGTGNAVHKNRPSHGLCLNMAGEKEFIFSNGEKLTAKENDIIYLPKHSTYNVAFKVNGDCYAINFDIFDDISFPPFVVKAKQHNLFEGFFSTARRAWEQKRASYKTKCMAELYNIIYALQQEYFSEYFPKNKLELIKKAIDNIHLEYIDGNVSVENLARECNITPEYFRRIFKSFYGVSPVSYINNLKITRAKELLESQMYSVSEVADMAGFNEISYFSREFKKITGLSPLEYMKKKR